jgi:hypothetical protein
MTEKEKMRQAEQEVDERHAKLYGGKGEEGSPKDTPEPVDVPIEEGQPAPSDVVEPMETDEGEPSDVIPEPVEPALDDDPDSGTWEHKFKTMQGRHKAEKERNGQRITDLESQVRNLMEINAALSRTPDPPPIPAPQPLMTDDEMAVVQEELGDKGVQMLKRYEQRIIDQSKTQSDEISALKQQVGALSEGQQKTAKQIFDEAVIGAIPSIGEVVQTADYEDWLKMRMPGTNYTHLDFVQDALDRNSVTDYVALATTFMEGQGISVPTASAPQKKPTLESQVIPSNTRVAQQAPLPKKTTQADVNKTMEKLRRGHISPADADKVINRQLAEMTQGV